MYVGTGVGDPVAIVNVTTTLELVAVEVLLSVIVVPDTDITLTPDEITLLVEVTTSPTAIDEATAREETVTAAVLMTVDTEVTTVCAIMNVGDSVGMGVGVKLGDAVGTEVGALEAIVKVKVRLVPTETVVAVLNVTVVPETAVTVVPVATSSPTELTEAPTEIELDTELDTETVDGLERLITVAVVTTV
jgi:hypothetical protein